MIELSAAVTQMQKVFNKKGEKGKLNKRLRSTAQCSLNSVENGVAVKCHFE